MTTTPSTVTSDYKQIYRWKPSGNHLTFRKAGFDKIPSGAFGVYGMWYGKRCIYVGKAAEQTIGQRLEQHWKGSHNPDLAAWVSAKGSQLRVRYIVVNNPLEIDRIEKRFIKQLQPLANKQGK